MLTAGFAEVDITPQGSWPLAGYFNERRSSGVLAPLFAKAAVLGDGRQRVAIVVLDSIGVWRQDSEAIRRAVASAVPSIDEVLITATHTHTAPAPADLFGAGEAREYIERVLRPGAVQAIKLAAERGSGVTVKTGEVQEHGLAFIRRFWMKDGRVITNPPKGDPSIVRPERQPDHTVRVFAFEQGSALTGLIVCATNHCDTIGGDRISAEWPGLMARAIERGLGDLPVLYLNGFAGDVNHFDPANPAHQASYEEAQRIGTAYAGFALQALNAARPASVDRVIAKHARVGTPLRKLSADELARARALVAQPVAAAGARMTAEEMAKGDPAVERLFAQQLLSLGEDVKGKTTEPVEIAALALGEHAFVFLPGEPFTDLGDRIRQGSPFATTTMVELYEHFFGYIPMPEHFPRGGYEPRSTMHNRLAPEAGPMLIDAAIDLLRSM